MTTAATAVEEPKETPIHDLFSREIRPIRNWCEWLERWQSAATLEEMLGLLHVGFNVPIEKTCYEETEYHYKDKIIFYLNIADGWKSSLLLRRDGDDGRAEYRFGVDRHGNIQKKNLSQLRQVLATKAFDVLCMSFFRLEELSEVNNRDFMCVWERVLGKELFPMILKFFRAEKDCFGTHHIRNLSGHEDSSHNEKEAITFLLNMAKFLWEWEEVEIRSWDKKPEETQRYNSEMRTFLEKEAKPWMVEVLSTLGRLDVLEKKKLSLSKQCLAKLKEIALRCELSHHKDPVMKDRKVANLDEACYAGSKAAWFLKRLELEKSEGKRLDEILEAQRAQMAAERKVRALTS